MKTQITTFRGYFVKKWIYNQEVNNKHEQIRVSKGQNCNKSNLLTIRNYTLILKLKLDCQALRMKYRLIQKLSKSYVSVVQYCSCLVLN